MKEYIKFLKEYVAKYKRKIIFASILSLISMLFILLNPIVTRILVDSVFTSGNFSILNKIIFLIVIFTVINSMIHFIYSYSLNKIFLNLGLDIKKKLFSHIVKLDLQVTKKMSVGEINFRIFNDSELLKQSFGQIMFGAVFNIILLVFIFVYMYTISPVMTIFVGAISLIQSPIIIYFTKRIRAITFERKAVTESTLNRTIEVINSFHLLKSCNNEECEIDRFNENNKKLLDKQLEETNLNLLFTEISNLVISCIGFGSIWIGGNLVLGGIITIGELMSFLLVSNIINTPISSIVSVITGLQDALSSTKRISDVMKLESNMDKKDNDKKVMHNIINEINIKNLNFSYDNGKEVLKDINLSVNKNTICSIVGRSGAGKTTLCLLIARLFNPTDGKIMVDNIDIKDIDIDSYRKNIGIVLQNSFLFSGSIRENILLGKSDATEEEVIEAAKAANAHDFILELEDGYWTQIGSKERNLSGGQLQRIALARIFLQKPQIVILDEPTSFIDSESEELIQNSIERLKEYSTIFIISHKLSTVKKSNKIAVLNNGIIEAVGTHDELLKNSKKYSDMYKKILA
ncbi:ABC transporter ATP-binding protein [Clostridium paraputrificum]|uniref:ABC transporter ATP-binding protein n=1 Tax=Clostridium paraputrificum TaxID=29363 RepID=UPI003D352D22